MTFQTATEILIAFVFFTLTCSVIALIRYYFDTRSYLNDLKKQIKR
jgi:hypothetical protein